MIIQRCHLSGAEISVLSICPVIPQNQEPREGFLCKAHTTDIIPATARGKQAKTHTHPTIDPQSGFRNKSHTRREITLRRKWTYPGTVFVIR